MNNIILETKNLLIGYKNPILAEINICASRSDFISIIGRNGVGKSTFLNTISGIQKPISGKIFVENKDFLKLRIKEKSQLISFVPSRLEFFSNLSVYDLIALGRSPYTNILDKKTEIDKKIISEVLENFNLTNLKNKALYEISDGERQRAMIGRAITQQTPIILLDEPTAFLDYYTKQKLFVDLLHLTKDKNICVILSTHDIDIALKYSNKVWLFSEKVEAYTEEEIIQKNVLYELMGYIN
ncbi:MAG: ABC transporter ATP-binding protein [Bacteroidales bacterium]|jgi:iron complex transport system ATP-binding protein|nr:ABC transporter ATP-binding protein [Bacteroidales bacterium]